jgi:proline dehydrogenase
VLRNVLLWASKNPFLAERLPRYRFVRRATRRFLPGETLEEAVTAAERLKVEGIPTTTLSLLGENVTSAAEADEVADEYLRAMETVESAGIDTELSVKLTQLGLDQSPDEARHRLDRLARACDGGRLLWIDMEGSEYLDATLELFKAVREDHPNVGLCLQAYLHRTAEDLEGLLPLHPAIRLVKGAYREPPEVAFRRKADVDRNYVRLAGTLLRARRNGRAGRPVFGTHDPNMVGEANRLAYELGLEKEAYEFAMLYGIQAAEQARLARSGYGMRVLISYGQGWFPWYMRRLAERPANVWFVVRQLVG